MGSELFLILVGIVLRANDTWFNGAHAVGNLCLFVGIGIAAIEVTVLAIMIAVGASATTRHRGRRR